MPCSVLQHPFSLQSLHDLEAQREILCGVSMDAAHGDNDEAHGPEAAHGRKRRVRGGRGQKGRGQKSHGGNTYAGDRTPVNTNEFLNAVHEHDGQGGDEDADLEGVEDYLSRIAYSELSTGSVASAASGDEAALLVRPKDQLVAEILSLRSRLAALEARVVAAESEVAMLRSSSGDVGGRPRKRARTGGEASGPRGDSGSLASPAPRPTTRASPRGAGGADTTGRSSAS